MKVSAEPETLTFSTNAAEEGQPGVVVGVSSGTYQGSAAVNAAGNGFVAS